jgi:hypothetical protein
LIATLTGDDVGLARVDRLGTHRQDNLINTQDAEKGGLNKPPRFSSAKSREDFA